MAKRGKIVAGSIAAAAIAIVIVARLATPCLLLKPDYDVFPCDVPLVLSKAGEAHMADLLPELVTLKGRKKVQWRRKPGRGGTFDFLTDAQLSQENGRILLRFSNGIANKGPGPLEVGGDPKRMRVRNGRRSMPAYQRIQQTDGDVREVYVGRMVFDPDPDHRHWHFAGFAEYRLIDSQNRQVRRSRKQAFCLIDFDRIRSGAKARYKGCRPERMGISPGWADTYTFDLHGQHIDVTNLPSGKYRLESVTNPSGRLLTRKRKAERASIRIRIDKVVGSIVVFS